MNTKKLCKVLLLAACTGCLAGCGDDDDAISLVNTQGSELLSDNGASFKLSPFSSGDAFYISGGDGAYSISNTNEAVVRFSYDGQTVTFYPVGPGTSHVTIQDHSGNLYTLEVEVAYPEERFVVNSQSASIDGDNLTVGEQKALEKRVVEELPIPVGGEYCFTYMSPDSTEGRISLYAKQSGTFPEEGNFQRKWKYFENGSAYLEINVQLTNGDTLIYQVIAPASSDGAYSVGQDVTAKYKEEYPALESAYVLQILQAIDAK